MLTLVKSLLFHYLVSVHLLRLLGISFFLVIESCARARTFDLLFDYEVRLHLHPHYQAVLALNRIFTNILKNFISDVFFFLPFWDVITCLFVLKPFQNKLIFTRDLGQFSLPCLSIKRSSASRWSRLSWHQWLNGHLCSCLAHKIRSLHASTISN